MSKLKRCVRIGKAVGRYNYEDLETLGGKRKVNKRPKNSAEGCVLPPAFAACSPSVVRKSYKKKETVRKKKPSWDFYPDEDSGKVGSCSAVSGGRCGSGGGCGGRGGNSCGGSSC